MTAAKDENGPENQEGTMQESPNDARLQPRRSYLSRWRQTTIANKLSVVLTAATVMLTAVIAISNAAYVYYASKTLGEIRNTGVDTRKLAEATEKQSEASREVAESTKEIATGTLTQAERTKQIADQALAQAKATDALVRETRSLAVSTERSAKAADSAARTAFNQLELSVRPWVQATVSIAGPLTFDGEGGANIVLRFDLVNTGRSPAFRTHVNARTRLMTGRVSFWPRHYLAEVCQKDPGAITLFPNSPFYYQLTFQILKDEITKANQESPGRFWVPTVVSCITYGSGYDSNSDYYTAYAFDLFHVEPNGQLSGMFKIGERIDAKNLRLRHSYTDGILAK